MPAVGKKPSKVLRKLKKEFEDSKRSLHRLREKFADGLSKGLERKWVSRTNKAEAALREARVAAGVEPGKPEFLKEPNSNTPATGKPAPAGSQSHGKCKADKDLDTEVKSKRLKSNAPAGEPCEPVAKPKAKRRAVDTCDGEMEARKRAKHEFYQPMGLTNHKLACFSNVVIQTIGAATHDQNLDTLFGRPSIVETFEMTTASLRRCGKSSRLSTRQLKDEREKLRTKVKSSAAAGERSKVSVTKHLRLLLQDMKTASKDAAACPYLLQNVLAFGGPEQERHLREKMSGDSQEDCHEYFTTIMNALQVDPLAHNAAGVNALFELETETRDICQSDCGYKADEESSGLQTLIETSLKSESDRLCTGCKTSTIRRETTAVRAPQELVVKVDRLSFDQKRKRVLKSEAAIDFSPKDDLRVDGHRYRLDAVIMHDGTTPQRGHYTILRRVNNTWWLLDDDEVISVAQDQIKDGTNYGQSAMFLLKKGPDV
ncbi:hypothetical protein LTR78_005297 [Recurvomyces mirabilis]|uniref:ubiquitinyl hydrolase 1 n=1 Tax=Recurvomyces mirabilis TaxID=574656 RepID=A0AAE1C215_9PEZI|nr:hypothetical protein LTR78_005297 [Recurvomyces mirabilis]KAK5157847.1 ATP-dependent DNA helicase srs2 [Recurvomyces mirabilis]